MAELFASAGTQFDPDLVELFGELHYADDLNSSASPPAGWTS